jgi:hypothetical protein
VERRFRTKCAWLSSRRLLVLLPVWFHALGARAETAQPRFQLEWVRGGRALECADEAELRRRIVSELGTDPFTDTAERVITVRAGDTAEGLVADVALMDAEGRLLGTRHLSTAGNDCATLMDAVVFAAVMTIDPDWTTPEPRESAAPTKEAPTEPSTSVASGLIVLRRGEMLLRPPPGLRSGALHLVGRALFTHGFVPASEPGLELGLDAPLGDAGWGIQGHAMAVLPGEFSGSDGSRVDVSLLAGSVLARYQWRASTRWLLEANAGMTGGAFHTNVHGASAQGPTWYADWGVRSGVAGTFALSPWLGLEASAAGLFSLHRQQFSTPSATWAQPFLGVMATLGIVAQLYPQ